jgi:hypothetical protein
MNVLCNAKITAVNTYLTNYANFFPRRGGKHKGGGGEAANLQSPKAEVAAIVRFAKTSEACFLVMYNFFFAYKGKPLGCTNVPSPVAI